MSFFERYFAALDGPSWYSSLELVSDDVEFAIEWAAGEDRKASQLRGGKAELRAFIDAGDMDGWAHYVVWSARDGDTEFALGETRWDDGRFIGTFLAVAHLDADEHMTRLHGRPVAGNPVSSPARRCTLSCWRGRPPGAGAARLGVPALLHRDLPAADQLPALHVDRRRPSTGSRAGHAVVLDSAGLPRRSRRPTSGRDGGVRALRRRLCRAAGRGDRRGAADRGRPARACGSGCRWSSTPSPRRACTPTPSGRGGAHERRRRHRRRSASTRSAARRRIRPRAGRVFAGARRARRRRHRLGRRRVRRSAARTRPATPTPGRPSSA